MKINYIQEEITLDMLVAGSDPVKVATIISEVNAEMDARPLYEKPLATDQAIKENLELVLYANRVPAVAKLFQEFFKLGIPIVVSHVNSIPTAEGAVNPSTGYHLEDSVKRLLLACRAGDWVRWDVGKVFNHVGFSPMDEIIGNVYGLSVPASGQGEVCQDG